MWTVPAHRNCYILHTCSRTCGATGRTKASNRLPQLCEGCCPGCNCLAGEGCLKLQPPWQNMSSHDKVKAMDHWRPKDSSIQVMVCTSAFGMGVDVANIDLVIKIGCPSSVEELVQMFGRARWKKSRRYMCVHCTCCLWFMYKYFRCIVSDNCVFTYILVRAFSCIQSQISNMLLSDVRD